MNNNKISIIGHVGQDPSLVSFDDTGNKVAKFSVAVKEYSSKSDEEKTIWFDVDAWNGLAERVMNTITKGREVSVDGRLSLSTYSKDVNGTQVQMTKPVIKLTGFYLCGKKPTSNDETQPEEPKQEAPKRRLAAAKG